MFSIVWDWLGVQRQGRGYSQNDEKNRGSQRVRHRRRYDKRMESSEMRAADDDQTKNPTLWGQERQSPPVAAHASTKFVRVQPKHPKRAQGSASAKRHDDPRRLGHSVSRGPRVEGAWLVCTDCPLPLVRDVDDARHWKLSSV